MSRAHRLACALCAERAIAVPRPLARKCEPNDALRRGPTAAALASHDAQARRADR